jgi:hypothetical protein
VSGAVAHSVGVVSLGGAMMGAVVPGSFVFVNRSTKGRMFFGLLSLAVVSCGIRALLLGSDEPEAGVWAISAMLIVFVSPKISTSPALNR